MRSVWGVGWFGVRGRDWFGVGTGEEEFPLEG